MKTCEESTHEIKSRHGRKNHTEYDKQAQHQAIDKLHFDTIYQVLPRTARKTEIVIEQTVHACVHDIIYCIRKC